jgi:predicted HNH restriction endonuclease
MDLLNRKWRIYITLLSCSLFIYASIWGQASTPEKAFDFLLGKWKVTEKRISGSDTTYHGTSVYTIYKSHDGTTIKDDWVYKNADTVVYKSSILRNYDAANKRWMLYYSDNAYRSQIWEGRFENNEWWFYRERMQDGKRIIIKIKWVSVNSKMARQSIYRSFDEGKSWVLGSILDYKKSK